MSEDLSKFKKKRTAVRSSLTKLINKIEGKINNENEPVDQFEAFIEQLNDKESNLSLLNTLIEDRLSVDTITEDMEASEEIKEKIIFWKTKLSSKIRRINSDSIQVDTVSRNIQVNDSNSFECMNINLPKLHINKYSGNYSEWLDFYNLFESSIHNNNRLSKVDKFNYLKSYLCGNALACINGFPISDDNYDRALDLLKDRFGNKNMLINAHLSNLLNLTPVRNPTDIVGLRNLYDRAETQIRGLASLGVKGESYSNLLTPILSKQIPSELVLEFNRSQKDEGFDLSALLRFLHLEIRSRERASQINSHKSCHYSPPPQDRTKNKGSYFPGQHMKPPPNKVHLQPHSFPTPWEKVQPRNRKCLYCNKGHELDTCRSFSAHEKREILRKRDCCFLCLSPGHRAMECVKRESCPICNGSHHFSICFRNRHDDDLSPKRDTDNIVSAVIETDSEDILTMSVIVNESNISKQLSEFWNLENLGIEAEVSDEENIDNDIMSEFEAGISYQNKLYKVKFPWKPNMKTLLENNEEIARKRFLKLRSRFKKDSSLFEDYKLVVNNYLSEKIIERVPFEEENLKHNIFYLPHRAVIPDIKMAFLMIEIDESERDFTRFFWDENPGIDLENKRLDIFRMTRVLFGVKSSPFLLAATIKHHLKKYVDIFPDTFNHLNQSLYVDDFLCGNVSVHAALTTCIESKQILEDASMDLRKWRTNSSELNQSTKATHLEVVSDLTTEAFLACLRRFIARRSKPSVIWSDNATNLEGARNILSEWNEICKSNRIQLFSAEEGIEWNFIPPASPHFGALWEANIKSMKHILLRVAKSAIMNFEELTTLMAQIEAVLNSRPLSPLSSDPNDLNPLTPGHFLTNCVISSFPEPYTASDSLSYHSRWKLVQSLRDKFWNRWGAPNI
ncbi:uncharacterized protein TNCV_1092911 [Trichonephila clavipes]|nr:uncharacterized protein TNCV_1092911 [Trichonephila clavipes]